MASPAAGDSATTSDGMESADWRKELKDDTRGAIITKLIDMFNNSNPNVDSKEIAKSVLKLEKNVFNTATNQIDYMQKILDRKLIDEKNIQNLSLHVVANSSCAGGQKPSGLVSSSIQSRQDQGQEQLHTTRVNPSQAHSQTLPQNIIPSSFLNLANLSAARFTRTGMANFVGQDANLPPNMGGIGQNSKINSLGVQSNVFSHTRRQRSQRQSQNTQHQRNMQSSMLNSPLQQQPSASGPQTDLQSGLQQSQLDPCILHQHQQSLLRNQQKSQQSSVLPQHLLVKSSNNKQKELLFQAHRLPEASSSYHSSTAPIGHSDIDWQEETYNKLQSLKYMYYTRINALCMKFKEKYQQLDADHQEEKPAEMDRLKSYITGFDCILQFLNSPKSAVREGFAEKLAFYERKIKGGKLSKLKQPAPLVQQPNSPAAASFSVMSQNLQQHDNPVKQTPPMSVQVNDMDINMQRSPISSLYMPCTTYMSLPHAQEGMLNSLQPAQNLDAALGNAFIASPENHKLIEKEQLKQLFFQQNQQLIEQQQLQEQQWNLMRQTHQMNDDIHTGMFSVYHPQTHQMNVSYPQSFLVSSPQASHSKSPQKYQHTPPQMDQQNIHVAPLIAELPFTQPTADSPSSSLSSIIIEIYDSTPEMSSMSGSGNVGSEADTQANTETAVRVPASPFLDEFSDAHGNVAAAEIASVIQQPLDRLLKSIKSLSPDTLKSAIDGINCVVSTVDRIAGSAPGYESRSIVGEDLALMTECKLRALACYEGSPTSLPKKLRREFDAKAFNAVPPPESEAPELKSTTTSKILMPKGNLYDSLSEEIEDINQRLFDTVVEISDEDVNHAAGAAIREGIIVKCSYNANTVSRQLQSEFATAHTPPIMPLRLLVPTNYPSCSPIFLDKFSDEAKKEIQNLCEKTKSLFTISFQGLPHPISLEGIARTWDTCIRLAVDEYARQSGGGCFSSVYGTWEIGIERLIR